VGDDVRLGEVGFEQSVVRRSAPEEVGEA
jgi:hypothetical protein